MKKFLILPLAAALLTTSAAFAETEVISSVDENNNVAVSVKSDNGSDTIYTMMIMRPGREYKDSMKNDSITDVYKAETLKNGGEFKFKAGTAGLYQIVSGGGELDGNISYFAIADKDVRDEALSKLNSADVSGVKAVLDEYNNRVWVIDFTDAVYAGDSPNVLKSLVNLIDKSAKSAGDVERCFRNACALSELQKASADKVLGILERHKKDFGLTYSAFIESGDASIMRAFTYLAQDAVNNPINSIKQLETVLNRAEALGSVNSATRKNMQEIIEKYPKELDIDLTGKYTSVDKYEVIKLLIKESGEEYKSIKEFSGAFASAVNKVDKNESEPVTPNGNGGGSSGSGGGGGTRGSVSISPDLNENDPGKEIGTKGETETKSEYFDDVFMSDWAQPYIDYVAYKGIMSGDGDRHFRPNDKISREEFLKVVIEALKIGKNEAAPAADISFDDVNRDDWFFSYIETGVGFKLINGVSEHSFGTGEPLTRQDAAVILMRAKEAARLVLTDTAETADFSDKADISDYASDAVLKLQKAGIINGYEDGSFNPNGSITRSEAAKIIYGILKNTNTL